MARIVASVAMLACSALAAPQFQGDSSNARILPERESLGQLSPRKTEWSTERRAGETMRGLDNTATLGMMGRPTLSNTPLGLMDSESSEVTTSLAGDRHQHRTRM